MAIIFSFGESFYIVSDLFKLSEKGKTMLKMQLFQYMFSSDILFKITQVAKSPFNHCFTPTGVSITNKRKLYNCYSYKLAPTPTYHTNNFFWTKIHVIVIQLSSHLVIYAEHKNTCTGIC